MRLSFPIFALIINASIAKTKAQAEDANSERCLSNGDGCAPTTDGYTYKIYARKFTMISGSDHLIAEVRPSLRRTQIINYYTGVDEIDPLIIGGNIKVNDDIVYSHDAMSSSSRLTACDKLNDNSWEYVVLEVVHKAFSENGACHIEAGRVTTYRQLKPINVTFDSMIPCGVYHLETTLFVVRFWVMNATFLFDIPNDGNCIP